RAGLQVRVRLQDALLSSGQPGPKIVPDVKRPGGSPFPVDPSELGRLDAYQATALFKNLLHAEAFEAGLPSKCVVISSNIHVKDGGIDATVHGVVTGSSLLRTGNV